MRLKPHIKKWQRWWICYTGDKWYRGSTPQRAYEAWEKAERVYDFYFGDETAGVPVAFAPKKPAGVDEIDLSQLKFPKGVYVPNAASYLDAVKPGSAQSVVSVKQLHQLRQLGFVVVHREPTLMMRKAAVRRGEYCDVGADAVWHRMVGESIKEQNSADPAEKPWELRRPTKEDAGRMVEVLCSITGVYYVGVLAVSHYSLCGRGGALEPVFKLELPYGEIGFTSFDKWRFVDQPTGLPKDSAGAECAANSDSRSDT